MKVSWQRYTLRFRERAITSRDSIMEKDTWFVRIESEEVPGGEAVGEAAMFNGLSREDTPDYEQQLDNACRRASQCGSLEEMMDSLPRVSSIRAGFESALLRNGLYPTTGRETAWLEGKEGIRINGLVWMGDKSTMRRRIREKLDNGFHCVKLKIGGIRFEDELELIDDIRKEFSTADIELASRRKRRLHPGERPRTSRTSVRIRNPLPGAACQAASMGGNEPDMPSVPYRHRP